MEELRGHLLGDESIFTFTRGCADFRDPIAVFRLILGQSLFNIHPAMQNTHNLNMVGLSDTIENDVLADAVF
jgi:hypothetical protein